MDKRTDAVLLRLSSREKQIFLAAADNAGMSLASWMRSHLVAQANSEFDAIHKRAALREKQ
jgi:hypothetical protein